MGVILDTSIFVEAERSRGRSALALQPGSLIFSRAPVTLGISVLTLTELVFGYERNHRYTAQQSDLLVSDLVSTYTLFPLTHTAAISAGRLNSSLRRNGFAIGLADVLIAATALEQNWAVLTHNARHFAYVPNLIVLDAASL